MNPESPPQARPAGRVWQCRFPASPRLVAVARHAAVRALADWGVSGEDAGRVELVVSELVTNAVRHGRVPGRLVLLALVYDGGKGVTVEVSDAGGARPEAGAAPPAGLPDGWGESGRGLTLVGALSDGWGVRERAVGKTVWARLLVAPPA